MAGSSAVATEFCDRLSTHIVQALQRSGYPALGHVEVLVHAGRVILQGSVPTYYLKQLAQQKVLTVSGVVEVSNRLEVSSNCPAARRRS